MKGIKVVHATCSLVAAISVLATTTLFADGRTPGTSDEKSTCNCGKTTEGDCSWNSSSQSTLCDCGSQCCKGSGNTTSVTITPHTGGTCTATGCFGANEGTAIKSTGELKTGDCGS